MYVQKGYNSQGIWGESWSLSPLQLYCRTVLMNQWQRTSQFIHWCEGLNVWNREKQQTSMKDKKGSDAGVLVRFCGWRLSNCWFLILSCLFFLCTLNCGLLCWGKFSISFHFIVSFALSGTTLASHLLLHHPPGPTGKVPWVCVVDVTSYTPPSQETIYSLVCDSFSSKVCSH